ncbi:cupin domain-containing protein [Priestia taiwanensis]|uniref:Cupin type-2 domain-containing protein n=1 Tax=Priestia taiwanensis TaxID=1347902 RepID=A0A917AMK9_9BACI|nr:cupin domain-containing protein [Priestia taiwanensis]MBM7362246.1 mannose-6-phosphate isomerase-like protein (cupin superfamily) [Priestia taiwanensis]GGE60630.1 hypothetical protein GCM10007140_08670 [Priestia taiwanensis]
MEKKNAVKISSSVEETYKNVVLENVNNHCIRLAVFTGEYDWHKHPDSDEVFMVLEGQLFIDVENSDTIIVEPNEIVKIPAGLVHRTRSEVRTVNLCFEKEEAETVFVKVKN